MSAGSRINGVAVTTAVIGLIADVITIGGLAIGLLHPSSLPLPSTSDGIVGAVTFAILFYCLAVVCCALFLLYEKRVRAAGVTRRERHREMGIAFITAYALWIPPYALWLLYVYGDWSGGEAGFWLVVLMLGGSLIGGFALVLVAAVFGELLWPYADKDFVFVEDERGDG